MVSPCFLRGGLTVTSLAGGPLGQTLAEPVPHSGSCPNCGAGVPPVIQGGRTPTPRGSRSHETVRRPGAENPSSRPVSWRCHCCRRSAQGPQRGRSTRKASRNVPNGAGDSRRQVRYRRAYTRAGGHRQLDAPVPLIVPLIRRATGRQVLTGRKIACRGTHRRLCHASHRNLWKFYAAGQVQRNPVTVRARPGASLAAGREIRVRPIRRPTQCQKRMGSTSQCRWIAVNRAACCKGPAVCGTGSAECGVWQG